MPVLPNSVDHHALLRDREFQNILVQKTWVSNDIVNAYMELEPSLERIVADLAASVRD